jgi:hypothetical protein
MGYRSSIYFVLPTSYWHGLMAIGKKTGSGPLARLEIVADWVDSDWIVEPDDLDYWNYSNLEPVPMHFGEMHGIKWYREGGGVITAFEDYLINKVPEELWGMIIVGEDPEDNEFLGNPYDFDMWLERSVNMPGQNSASKVEEPEPEPIDPNLPVPINWLRSLLEK